MKYIKYPFPVIKILGSWINLDHIPLKCDNTSAINLTKNLHVKEKNVLPTHKWGKEEK